jgi:hypothetical protein
MRIKRFIRSVFGGSLVLSVIFLFIACPEPPEDKSPPDPPQNYSINLEIISANTYTAQFRISAGDTLVDWMYSLQKNGEEVHTALVFSTDTSITDSNLTANTEYSYKAYMIDDGEKVDSSASVTIHTLEESINLELISTFTTTALFRISISDSTLNWSFNLNRDGNNVLTTHVYQKDSVIIDGGLSPNTQYSYQAVWINEDIAVDTSENVTAQTMDTTSHNFTWEIDTLGGYGSYLRDVAIIDENNIWVVGMIKIPDPDSSFNGTGWESFNAAHWDGVEWELIKVLSGRTRNTGIQYFSENDIWVTSGFPIHWDGIEWTLYHLQNMGLNVSVEHLWGTSSSNMYFAGLNGSIVHYDGSTFTEMESGTQINLLDVNGNGENVFATGYESSGTWGGHSIALAYEDGEWVTIKHDDRFTPTGVSDWGLISSVWAGEDEAYFMTYAGIKFYNYTTREASIKYTSWEMGTSTAHISKIRGNDTNDILLARRPGAFYHFNGMSWSVNFDIQNQYDVYIAGMDYQENIFVTVGWYHPSEQAIIVRGSRND